VFDIKRINDVMAQGCTTYSKRYDQFPNFPGLVDRVSNHKVVVGDCKYYDFTGALGATNLTIQNMIGLPFKLEIEIAELIQDRIKCIERLKFLKTGSEACLAAVRIARAYNNKLIVYGLGYHGWGDMFIEVEEPGAGAVGAGYIKYDSLQGLLRALELADRHLVSAVIVEPVMLEESNYVLGMLVKIREVCTEKEIVLIFDEVITGFRIPKYCIANYYNVQPDIMCLGKTIADGHPLSVVGGKEEIMNNPRYFVSSTFAGDLTSLEEAGATIRYNCSNTLDTLWTNGRTFFLELNGIFKQHNALISLKGYPTRMVWEGEPKHVYKFWAIMQQHGYILGKSLFYTWYVHRFRHQFLNTVQAVLKAPDYKSNLFKLDEFCIPKPIFGRSK